MNLLGFIAYIFGATFNLLLVIIKLILIVIIGAIAFFKGYNSTIWGLLTLILPWPFPIFIILLIAYLPRKLPKLPKEMRRDPAFEGKNPVVASIMALGAIIAKADGNVTKEEISLIKNFACSHFGISSEELNSYADAFEYGKNHRDEYEVFTNIIRGYYHTRRDYVLALAFLFTQVAFNEGELNPAKEQQARRVVFSLGLTEYEYQCIKQAILGTSQQADYDYYGQSQNYGGTPYQNQEQLVKKYTQVLGVSENASMSEIKKAYRKLVKEYHPDKLSGEGVSPEYVEFANQKIRDINEAYEYLEKVKGK